MKSPIALIAVTAMLGCATAADAQKAALSAIPKGAMPKAGYYMPQRLMLSSSKPSGITKEPTYSNPPLYGTIHFGPAADNSINLALDEKPDASAAKLYVDTNANGDLTDDPSATWTRQSNKVKNPQTGTETEMVIFQGSVEVHPRGENASSIPCNLAIYRFAPETAKLRGIPTDMLLYYRDYGREGKIDLGGKTYNIMILDELASGRYDQVAHGEKEPGKVSILIDRDGNGRFGKGEHFDLGQPFNIGGTTYELDKLSADGSSLSLKKSTKAVAEVAMPADLGSGKQAIAFSRPVLEGKNVSFPGDYKGKIVMLDFWATWCGPCRGEIPGLVKAYEKYHPKGFEVLGISLDREGKAESVKSFLKENKMSWSQVYDGKYWSAEVAKMYTIESIPAAFLVDGNTGKILASGNDLRGEALDGTIAKYLK